MRRLPIPRIPYKGALTPRLRDDDPPGETPRAIGFTVDISKRDEDLKDEGLGR